MDDLIRALICTHIIERAWAATNGRLEVRLEVLEKQMPSLVDEARAQAGLAELLAQESTATAVRAAAGKRADVARVARGEALLPSGIPLQTKGAHLDALTKRIQVQNQATEVERLRKVRTAAEAAETEARTALSARSGSASPAEREALQVEVGNREALAALARVNLSEAEEAFAKLGGAQ